MGRKRKAGTNNSSSKMAKSDSLRVTRAAISREAEIMNAVLSQSATDAGNPSCSVGQQPALQVQPVDVGNPPGQQPALQPVAQPQHQAQPVADGNPGQQPAPQPVAQPQPQVQLVVAGNPPGQQPAPQPVAQPQPQVQPLGESGIHSTDISLSLSTGTGVSGQCGNVSLLQTQGGENLAAVCAPLGDHVSQAIREKIGRGEYIDLGLLLENWSNDQERKEGFAITLDDAGRAILKQAKTPRRITSISAWTSAFLSFSSIYLAFHPQRTQDLLKYMHTIRSAAIRFASSGWRQYDINFRMRMQRNPQKSWASIDGELWYLYVVAPPAQRLSAAASYARPSFNQAQNSAYSRPNPSASYSQAQNSGSFISRFPTQSNPGPRKQAFFSQAPRPICFGFNKQEGCSYINCKFSHYCNKCKKPGHSALSCKTLKK